MAARPSFTAEGIAEAVGVHKAMLDKECSKENVKEISLFLKSWKTLAPYLNLEDTDIEEIDRDGGTEQEKRLKTLQKWKERFIFLATYKVLMEALLKTGRADQAMEVCRLLTGPPTTGHTELEGAAGTTPPQLESLPSSNIPHKGVGDEVPPSTTVEAPQIRASLPESLEDEIEELEIEFEGLVNEAADDIGQSIETDKVKLSRVKKSITLLPVSIRHRHIKFLQGKLSAINEAKNIRALFSILDLYWDFMNCGLLVHLVKRFGSMETKQMMGKYLKRLKDFRMRTTVREFTGKWTHKIPSNLSAFTMEMGEEWLDRRLEAVEEFGTEFSRLSSFERYTLPLTGSKHNSVILCFALQRSFPMSAEILWPARQFLQEQGVLRVFFKGVCLLDLRPPQAIIEGATGGSDIPTHQWEEYETSMEPEHISSEEDEEMDDQLLQDHGQQKKTAAEPGQVSREKEAGVDDQPHQGQELQEEEQRKTTGLVAKVSTEKEEVDDMHQELQQEEKLGHGFTRGVREKLTPDQQKSQREMKRHQRREKRLLQELQNPGREKHGRSRKSKRIGEKSLDEPSHTPEASPLEGLDYHPKYGSKLSRAEHMIIVSVGSEHPTDVRVEPKVEDKVRARQAVNAHGRLPDLVGLPLGTEVDLNVISGHIRADPRKELTDLQLDITGYQRSREYYLQAIRNFFTRCKQPGAMIWYTGHGEEGTGNWCFKDGTISFQEVFNLYREHFSGRLLDIVSDCCYSGHWVEACAETLDNLGIPPCGHKARENGVLLKVFTSCRPHQKAGDPCYSLEGVWLDKENQGILFSMSKQLSESQTTWAGDFTTLVCLRDPERPCQADNFKNWRWKDAVGGEMREATCNVKGKDKGRPAWHYVLLSSGDEEHVSAFKAQLRTGTIDVADWGHVLLSGWGEDVPADIHDKVYRWTYV